MHCAGFNQESHDLYALGVVDGEDAAAIEDHLQRGCVMCLEQFRESLERVTSLALTVPPAAPSRHLRGRLVASVRPPRAGWLGRIAHPSAGWASAAACLGIGLGAVWFAQTRTVSVAPPVVVSHLLPPSTVTVTTAAPRPQTAPPIANRPSPPIDLQQVHAEQQTRIAELEGQLRTKEIELTSSKQEIAARARLAAESEGTTARVQDLQHRLAAAEQQMNSLTSQVRFYQSAIQAQRVDLDRGRNLISLLSAPHLRLLDLKATEQGGAAYGRALLSENAPILFYASNLPPLPTGRTYQLWVMRDRDRAVTSGGVFQPDANHAAAFTVPNASGITALAITEEPSGGVPQPTGHKILIGAVKS